MALVYIGLGANLGERKANIENAKKELLKFNDIDIARESSLEETAPVDYADQPDFLNQIILIKTDIPPHDLLQILKSIEKKLGRKTTFAKGPRIIDIDILLYDDIILNDSELTIPHPEIKNRDFILKHLTEIDPDLIDPVSGERYDTLLL